MLLFGFIGLMFVVTLLAAIAHFAKITNFTKAFIVILSVFICIILLGWITSPLREKIVLDKDDYYGSYVINRKYFGGKQADWQYNTFRFEIRPNDSIYFYVTDRERILETYKGKVSVTDSKIYNSARLRIKMNEPSHHILTSNPTTYREVWDFILVFKSPKFYNVYFTKGNWKEIN